MNCLSLAKFSILWNGGKTQLFTPSRDARQGDPLSPYLFVLCIEQLNHIIEDIVRQGLGNRSMPIEAPPIIESLFCG